MSVADPSTRSDKLELDQTCVTSRGRKFAKSGASDSHVGFRAFSLYLLFHGKLGFIDGKFGSAGSRLSPLA